MEVRSKRKDTFSARQQAVVTVSRILLRVLMPNIKILFDTTLSLLIRVNIVCTERQAAAYTVRQAAAQTGNLCPSIVLPVTVLRWLHDALANRVRVTAHGGPTRFWNVNPQNRQPRSAGVDTGVKCHL